MRSAPGEFCIPGHLARRRGTHERCREVPEAPGGHRPLGPRSRGTVAARGHRPSRPTMRCCACDQDLVPSAFSAAQMKKKGKRRCADCTRQEQGRPGTPTFASIAERAKAQGMLTEAAFERAASAIAKGAATEIQVIRFWKRALQEQLAELSLAEEAHNGATAEAAQDDAANSSVDKRKERMAAKPAAKPAPRTAVAEPGPTPAAAASPPRQRSHTAAAAAARNDRPPRQQQTSCPAAAPAPAAAHVSVQSVRKSMVEAFSASGLGKPTLPWEYEADARGAPFSATPRPDGPNGERRATITMDGRGLDAFIKAWGM